MATTEQVDELLSFAPPSPSTGEENDRKQAETSLNTAEAMVAAYCRGKHKRKGEYREGVFEVILTVAARILANPGQISRRDAVGVVSIQRGVGFQGFTLVELAVLNRYRKRAV